MRSDGEGVFLWVLATLVPSRERAEIRNEVREVGGFPGIITYTFRCLLSLSFSVCGAEDQNGMYLLLFGNGSCP